jgi:DNA-directed RNA polymerase I subunit RPA1
VIEVTSPQAFDSLGTPLPHGLYDPLLGPTESRTTSPCPTCANLYQNCPGHSAHIELCVPVYQPLSFPKLLQLLRIKCLHCHLFRLQNRIVKLFTAKFLLVDAGRCHEAMMLDDQIAAIVRNRSMGNGIGNIGNGNNTDEKQSQSQSKSQGRKVKSLLDMNAAASSVDEFLQEIFQQCNTHTNHNHNHNHKIHKLTSHERSVRRNLLKEFISSCSACKNCQNCGAYSAKIRQDNSNKIFQSKLSDKLKKMNMGQNIRFVPAASHDYNHGDGDGVDGDGNGVNGWDSDDSDIDMEDEGGEDGEPVGHSTMSDDDDDDDVALLGRKQRQSTVSVSVSASTTTSGGGNGNGEKKSAKPDKFMHGFEVEAQVKMTWRQQSLICSKVFGNAHCIVHEHATASASASASSTVTDIANSNADANADGYSVFFMRAIPVPPSRFRPPMIMGTMTVEHAQNHYLNKVLELNDRLRIAFATVQGFDNVDEDADADAEDGNDGNDNNGNNAKITTLSKRMPMSKDQVSARALSLWIDLQTTINCYIDSSKDPSAAAANNVPNGIRQLLEKKEGIFRKHMMGKRVNFACRSVISPDPYIGTNEIGIPLYFAKVLTYPTPVTPRNVAEMRNLVIRGPNQYPGARWVELPNGRRIELLRMQQTKREAIAARLLSSNGIATVGRQLRDGDMVLMNRQVSQFNQLQLWL